MGSTIAWHGAKLSVIGKLLSLGADRRLKTNNKGQTPQEIAIQKHPERKDLAYVLAQSQRTPAQLMRKLVADRPDLFRGISAYTGNAMVCARMIECLTTSDYYIDEDIEMKLESAFRVVTGIPLSLSGDSVCEFRCSSNFSGDMSVYSSFWKDRVFPLLREYTSRAHVIPIEKGWAVLPDLVDPLPDTWEQRGHPHLWLEMRQALCRVEIPYQPEELAQVIAHTFAALTGKVLTRDLDFCLERIQKVKPGVGSINGYFWIDKFIPLLQQRHKWLQETWVE